MTEPETSPAERDRVPVPPPAASEPDTNAPETERPALGDTVGTGTSIALGCLAGTLLLIVIGVLFLVVVMIVG